MLCELKKALLRISTRVAEFFSKDRNDHTNLEHVYMDLPICIHIYTNTQAIHSCIFKKTQKQYLHQPEVFTDN